MNGSTRRGPTAGSRRGQSTTVGFVLLLGLVALGSAAVLTLGGTALADLQESTTVETSAYQMREVDARLSQVAATRTDVQVLDFGSNDRTTVRIENESEMLLTVNGDEANCRVSLPMGTIEREIGDERTIAYEGGGVWKETPAGATMVSPPDFQYQNGTVRFPMTQIDSSVESDADRLLAQKNRTASQEINERIRETIRSPACSVPQNLTIEVKSDYYRAWGRYFNATTGVEPTYDGTNRTMSVNLTKIGGQVTPVLSGKSVGANADYVADVKVLAIESSVLRDTGNDPDWTPDPAILNDPMVFFMDVDGERKTPWKDGDTDDANQLFEDDLNDPRDDGPFTATLTGNDSTTFEVGTTMYECGSSDDGHGDPNKWSYTGVNRTRSGTTYQEWRCTWSGVDSGNIRVEVSSDGSSNNFLLLEDGDLVPGNPPNNNAQKSLKEVLQDRINDNRTLDLQSNQVVYVYDISNTNADADCDDDGVDDHNDNWVDFDGDGIPSKNDPNISNYSNANCDDFNDAVVLVTLNGPGTVSAHAEFVISISVNKVTIEQA